MSDPKDSDESRRRIHSVLSMVPGVITDPFYSEKERRAVTKGDLELSAQGIDELLLRPEAANREAETRLDVLAFLNASDPSRPLWAHGSRLDRLNRSPTATPSSRRVFDD
jgi:hypothetical protein